MAHKQQQFFIEKTKHQFPQYFKNSRVLNIGAFNVNGGEEQYFESCDITGLDIGPGKGVDVICSAHKYDKPDCHFDTIISCECWEHNPFYKESVLNAIRMLKSGGFFIFTCATTGRPVHGTKKQDALDKAKGATLQGNLIDKWVEMPNVSKNNWDNDYYKNVTEQDVRSFVEIEDVFSDFLFEVNDEHCDLYFWGIKK